MVEQQYFPELVIDGQLVDLSHLEPFTFVFHSLLAKRDLRVHVTFSNHCFSHSYDPAIHPVDEKVMGAKSPRPRVFCPTRYRLSQQLPELVRGLNHPKVKVWETSRERNWCYSIKIDDPEGPYHVFFEVRRATKEKRQWQDLNMVIESAYHQDQDEGPDLKGSMAFVLLCGKVYLGKPTSTKR